MAILEKDLDPYSWMSWHVKEMNHPFHFVPKTLSVDLIVLIVKMLASFVRWVRNRNRNGENEHLDVIVL